MINKYIEYFIINISIKTPMKSNINKKLNNDVLGIIFNANPRVKCRTCNETLIMPPKSICCCPISLRYNLTIPGVRWHNTLTDVCTNTKLIKFDNEYFNMNNFCRFDLVCKSWNFIVKNQKRLKIARSVLLDYKSASNYYGDERDLFFYCNSECVKKDKYPVRYSFDYKGFFRHDKAEDFLENKQIYDAVLKKNMEKSKRKLKYINFASYDSYSIRHSSYMSGTIIVDFDCLKIPLLDLLTIKRLMQESKLMEENKRKKQFQELILMEEIKRKNRATIRKTNIHQNMPLKCNNHKYDSKNKKMKRYCR